MTRRPNIPPLTSLRFIAAFSVVLTHYAHSSSTFFQGGPADFGQEAVTFFFILSGFVLTYAHGTTTGLNVSKRDFIMLRLARLAPAYYLGLAIIAPFFLAALIKKPDIWPAAALTPLMLQAWLPKFSIPWNAPAWSLSNELFFYLTYPAIWGLISRFGERSKTIIMLSLVPILTVFILRELGYPGWQASVFKASFPLFNLPQFIFGMALGNHFIRSNESRFRTPLLIVGGVGVCISMAWKQEYYLLSTTALLCPLFGCVIYGATAPSAITRLLDSNAMVVLGEASYATYILHLPILLWWHHLTRVVLHLQLSTAADFLAYSAIVLAASLLTLDYVEKPGKRFILNLVRTRAVTIKTA